MANINDRCDNYVSMQSSYLEKTGTAMVCSQQKKVPKLFNLYVIVDVGEMYFSSSCY